MNRVSEQKAHALADLIVSSISDVRDILNPGHALDTAKIRREVLDAARAGDRDTLTDILRSLQRLSARLNPTVMH